MMTNLIQKQSYICTTTDILSTNNKSYMGMTCYSLLMRLHIKVIRMFWLPIIGTHNFLAIAKVITEVMNTYFTTNSKVTHIISYNASNFGKCFRTYSSSTTSSNHLTANYNIDNLNSDESGNDTIIDHSYSESENGEENIKRIYVSSVFYNQEVHQDQEHDDSYCLPKHITCVANSLNLITTTDISKISDETYISLYTKTFNKLQAF